MADPTSQSIYDALVAFSNATKAQPHPWLYDVLKDFQPALAAVIALCAAAVAYYVGTAKLTYDRREAAFTRISNQLGICLRLRLRAERMVEVADALRKVAASNSIGPDRLYELLLSWPPAPELDEAWKAIEILPRRSLEDMAMLHYCHSELAGYATEERATWLDQQRPRTVIKLCSNLINAHEGFKIVLEEEIAALEKTRGHLHRSL